MSRPELHPACEAFPELTEAKAEALAADIHANGLLNAIILMPDGRLLDGRCRWDACERAGVEPRTEIYHGDDPIGFVRSQNEKRRHMTQEAMILAISKLTPAPVGVHSAAIKRGRDIYTATEIAAKAGAHKATVQRARQITERAAPNVIDLIERGEVGIESAALALNDSPSHEEQATWTKETIRQKARAHRDEAKGKPRGRPPTKPRRARRFVDPPYTLMKFPTAEETGFPVGGTLEEQAAHAKRYGRTAPHPQMVAHMHERRRLLDRLIGPVVNLTNEFAPDADAVIEALDAMLAWKPQPDPDRKGYGIKFQYDARERAARLDRMLNAATERLTAIRDAYAAWRATHPAEPASEPQEAAE